MRRFCSRNRHLAKNVADHAAETRIMTKDKNEINSISARHLRWGKGENQMLLHLICKIFVFVKL